MPSQTAQHPEHRERPKNLQHRLQAGGLQRMHPVVMEAHARPVDTDASLGRYHHRAAGAVHSTGGPRPAFRIHDTLLPCPCPS